MIVRCKRIPFFGNIIGADGIEPDPEKVTAICNMTAPTDVKELQTFIGLVNYLGRFTPHLATYSVSATQRFVRDERSLRLGTRTRCCIFKLESPQMRCFDTMTVQSHSSSKSMLRREDSGLHCCKPIAASHLPVSH